jgi:hypothetical protein
LLSPDGFRGEGSQPAIEIRLGERPEADTGAAQPVETPAEAHFVPDATDYEEGVFVIGREECPCGFQTGVTGLHHLLRVGQVAADEDVDVRPLINLPELHDDPPFW